MYDRTVDRPSHLKSFLRDKSVYILGSVCRSVIQDMVAIIARIKPTSLRRKNEAL